MFLDQQITDFEYLIGFIHNVKLIGDKFLETVQKTLNGNILSLDEANV